MVGDRGLRCLGAFRSLAFVICVLHFFIFFYNLLSLFIIIFILSLFFFVVENLEVNLFSIIGD